MPSFEHTKQGRVTVEDEVYKPGDNKQTDLETATTSATDSDQNNPALSRPGISWGELAKDKSKENEVPEIQEKPEPAPAAEATPVAEARDTATVEEAESANERPKPTPFNDKDLPDPGPAFLQRSAAQLARQEEDNLRKRRGVRGRNRVVSAAAKKTEPSFGEISSPAEVKESLSGRMAHGQPKTERRERREDAPTPKAEAEKQDTQATENIPAEPRESRGDSEGRQSGQDRPPRKRKRSRNRNRDRDSNGGEQDKRNERRPNSREKTYQDLSNKPNAPRSSSTRAKPKGLLGKIVGKISALFGGQPQTEERTPAQTSGHPRGEEGARKDFRPRKSGDGRPPRRRRRPQNKGKGNPRHSRGDAS